MGLLDVLNGMQNGPRGGGRAMGGGMSPITMALLGLLAYKAVKSFGGSAARAATAPQASSGGLGDLLKGGSGLGGLLTGGLGDLVKQFQGAGKGEVADSWVGTGPNHTIAPTDLSKVLTSEQIDFLTTRSGLSREELLAGLSERLPQVVDQLTPAGRLPTQEEMNRVV